MSERTEKQISRSERPTVTPQPTRPDFFDWVENKFDGSGAFPKYFELKLAFGPGGREYRPDTIHQKEFRPNIKKPEREEMVETSNQFVSIAQNHCNEIGRPQGYVVLAMNHTKGAHPYGVYYMKLRPTMFAPQETHGGGFGGGGGGGGDDGEITGDVVLRERFLSNSLDHVKANDEHHRFMMDGTLKSWAGVFSLQQEIIRELRAENATLKSQQLEWSKAVQEAHSTVQDREMKAATHKVKMEVIERSADMLMQMIPVVAKSLESRKNGALPSASEAIGPSPESIAIEQFAKSLSEEQKGALFGFFDDATPPNYTQGLFTQAQVKLFADVGALKLPATTLEALLPGGEHEITGAQIGQAQQIVPMDKLMPLYAMIMEGRNRPQPQVQ